MIWHFKASRLEGPKLLIIDSYPLHKDLENLFSKYDTHVMYVPPGLTWALQPLDCGFFKVLKDELKKLWISQQYTVFQNEAEKRKALSESLQSVLELQYDNRNVAFWEKAGLLYPQNEILPRRSNSEAMQEEPSNNASLVDDSAMIVEEGNNSDNSNLFADMI